MSETEALRQAILDRLATVIDPETGADVIRMRLVEALEVDRDGRVSYRFRPSSPLCPTAIPLAHSIKQAVAAVPGVTGQTVTVTNYVQAALLTQLLNEG